MLCCVLHGQEDIRLETRDMPRVGPDSALVRIRRVGICGSDVHYFEHGRAGSFVPKRPFVLGHEGAGEVAEVGAGVTDLTTGTRVAIDPSQPCHRCRYCRSGRYNLCAAMRFLGSASTDPHVDGVFCEYIAVPAGNCSRIPAGMTFAQAALVEPITIAMHALKRAGPIAGASVAIMGGGTIGQLALVVARAFGAFPVTVTEVLDERRALAKTLGADAAWNPADPSFAEQARTVSADGFDVVVEASGSPAGLDQSIELARRGGTIVVVGTLPAEVTLAANRIMTKELQVVGSFRSANVFDEAVRLASSRRVSVEPLITSVLPFSSINEAMRLAMARGSVMKVQLEV